MVDSSEDSFEEEKSSEELVELSADDSLELSSLLRSGITPGFSLLLPCFPDFLGFSVSFALGVQDLR